MAESSCSVQPQKAAEQNTRTHSKQHTQQHAQHPLLPQPESSCATSVSATRIADRRHATHTWKGQHTTVLLPAPLHNSQGCRCWSRCGFSPQNKVPMSSWRGGCPIVQEQKCKSAAVAAIPGPAWLSRKPSKSPLQRNWQLQDETGSKIGKRGRGSTYAQPPWGCSRRSKTTAAV